MVKPRLYLAGPDVFYANARERFAALRDLCAQYGFDGIAPVDDGDGAGNLPGQPGAMVAERIYRGNLALLRGCDGVLANLQPFRGAIEPDSGTVFEVGYAIALGKPVAGYLPDAGVLHEEKIAAVFGRELVDGTPYDRSYGFLIESLQQPANLMLARSSSLHDDAEAAVAHLQNVFRAAQALKEA